MLQDIKEEDMLKRAVVERHALFGDIECKVSMSSWNRIRGQNRCAVRKGKKPIMTGSASPAPDIKNAPRERRSAAPKEIGERTADRLSSYGFFQNRQE